MQEPPMTSIAQGALEMSRNDDEAVEYALEETNTDRLRRSTTADAMNVELVSAFAGDRAVFGKDPREKPSCPECRQ